MKNVNICLVVLICLLFVLINLYGILELLRYFKLKEIEEYQLQLRENRLKNTNTGWKPSEVPKNEFISKHFHKNGTRHHKSRNRIHVTAKFRHGRPQIYKTTTVTSQELPSPNITIATTPLSTTSTTSTTTTSTSTTTTTLPPASSTKAFHFTRHSIRITTNRYFVTSSPPTLYPRISVTRPSTTSEEEQVHRQEDVVSEEKQRIQQLEAKRKYLLKKLLEDEEQRRRLEEEKRDEEERKRLEEEERRLREEEKRVEEAKRVEEERLQKAEKLLKEQKVEEARKVEEKLKREEEEARLLAEEEKRLQEEELLRIHEAQAAEREARRQLEIDQEEKRRQLVREQEEALRLQKEGEERRRLLEQQEVERQQLQQRQQHEQQQEEARRKALAKEEKRLRLLAMHKAREHQKTREEERAREERRRLESASSTTSSTTTTTTTTTTAGTTTTAVEDKEKGRTIEFSLETEDELGGRTDVPVDEHEDDDNLEEDSLVPVTVPTLSTTTTEYVRPPVRNDDVTIVTGFIDIGRGDWFHYQRPLEIYHQFMENLLSLKNNMIIFTDHSSYDFIHKYRKNMGLMSQTKIHLVSIDDLPLSKQLPYAKDIIKRELKDNEMFIDDPDMKNHPEAKSAEYDIVVNSKTYFLYNATIEDPFDTDFFVWIDAGYGHGNQSVFPYDNLWKPKFPRGKISMIKLTPEHDPITKYRIHNLYRKNWSVISGGFIAGDKHSIGQLYTMVQNKFVHLIYQGYVDDDQTVMVLVINSYPYLFNITHGGWFDAFRFFSSDPDNQFG